MITIANINNGFSATFTRISGSLFCDVYLEDKEYKVLRRQSLLGGLNVCLENTILEPNQKYFVRFFTINNGLKSPDTDFFEFIPAPLVDDGLLFPDGSGVLLFPDGFKLLLQ